MGQHMHNKRNKVLHWMGKLDVHWMDKRSPSVHHIWYWFRCSTYILGVSLCSKIVYTVSTKTTTKRSAFQLSWKISHMWGRKKEHKWSRLRCPCGLMLMLGTNGQEPCRGTACSEKCLGEKKHSTKLTTAGPAPTSKEGHVPHWGNTLQQGATDWEGFWQSIHCGKVCYAVHRKVKSQNYSTNADTEMTSDFSAE